MKKGKIIFEKDYVKGNIDKRLFGSFIEHMGRAVYTGIYEPEHPDSDEQGFRKDVLELVKELQLPIVRYPGGNFVSGYHWTDGIGRKEHRPSRLELAWKTIETNEIGIDEFADWSKKVGTSIMAVVNLGTGTPKEAAEMVEYCNHPSGTYWSNMRVANGHKKPHNIRTWCLGNEMDGDWQICHLTADEYGRKAHEAAKMMKMADNTIELVASGSSSPMLGTYPEWDRKVLEHLYNDVDYISLHRYYYQEENMTIGDFLLSYLDLNKFIKDVITTADYVKTLKRSNKTMYLSLDEWNIWDMSKQWEIEEWKPASPRIEDKYSLLDALVLGGLICTMINHADRLKMGCLAQLVNVIAPILTEKGGKAIRQTIFYPFMHGSLNAKGKALNLRTDLPKIQSKRYGEADAVTVAATYDEEKENIVLFALNCSQNDDIRIDVDFRGFGNVKVISHTVLDGNDLNAKNTFENPNTVVPREMKMVNFDTSDGIVIPKMSWNLVIFKNII